MRLLRQTFLDISDRLPKSISFSLFVVSFVAGARLLGEWLILDGQNYYTYGALPHNIAFYLAMFVININNMSLILKKEWKEFYGIVGLGVLIGILPLFIDALIINPATQKYFYLNGFHPLLIDEKTLPLGETIALWTWVLGFGFYVFVVSNSWYKMFLGFIITYVSLHLVGYVSNLCKTYILTLTHIRIPGDYFWAMWWLLIAFGVTCIANLRQVKHAFFRIHHCLVWGILVLLGAKFLGYLDKITMLRAFTMALSFLFILIVNDYFDKETDRINRRESKITWDMVLFTIYCHILLVLTAGHLDFSLGVIAFLFFILGIAYSCPFVMRLKQNFVLGSLVEGCGAFLCLLAGGTQFGPPLNKLFLPVALFFAAGFTIASNTKDYKDFKGDLECNITTFYVYMHRRGWPAAKTNFWVSLMLAIVLLSASLLLLLIGVAPGGVALGCVLALLLFALLTKLPPKTAFNSSLIMIMAYLVYLMNITPRLPT